MGFDDSFKPFRNKLSAAIALTMLIPAALAQSPGANAIEEVVVTGSRIARDPNATSANPIQSVTDMDIRMSGSAEATDFLRTQPALLSSLSSEASADTGAQGGSVSRVGQSVLELRGMGANRTLVLVDGRRHVSGVDGSQAVDVGSIPSALIQRVEVLTGGASSIYGADAVTGVVNFILKDDFEGLDADVRMSQDGSGNGRVANLGLLFGQNFDEGRGNFTVGLDVMKRKRMLLGDQGFSSENRIATARDNPARRFQNGDISTSSTPNFARFYSTDQGRFPYGFNISTSAEGFLDAFEDEFGERPELTAGELALIQRRIDSTPEVITPFPSFSIANDRGIIAPIGFDLDTFVDTNNSGVHDCLESHQGFNGLASGFDNFGFAGGCWTVNDDGSIRPIEDGQITSSFNSIGGDGIIDSNNAYLTPDETKWALNFTGRYDLTSRMRVFGEAKYVNHTSEFGGGVNGFYDLLSVSSENPFIPPELAEVAANSTPPGFFGPGVTSATSGLAVTRDPTDIGRNVNRNTRETWRFVAGVEGELENGWFYEVSANYGRFDRKFEDRNSVIIDRYFAAIDAIADPVTGEAICRSDIDPTPAPTTPFGIPPFDPGFFTFNPGDGQCAPLNLFGRRAASPEAIDFVSTTTVDSFQLEQLVFSGSLAGQLPFFELPGGAIGFAVGAEYREEKSSSNFDALKRGVVPVTTPNATAGDRVLDLPNAQNNLVFNPRNIFNSSNSKYDVYDVFAEILLPLLTDVPFARELTVETSYRFSDYSTVGSTHTWAYGGTWAPIDDLRIRGTRSRAVRAPNITELFAPPAAVGFNLNIEPCTSARIQALIDAGDPAGPIRQANCAADVGADFENPLSAGFGGSEQGNIELGEESADTWTVGFVVQPRMLDGLTLSVDYWDIKIDDAISTVSGTDTLASCYDSPTFPNNPFCSAFDRNPDPNSAQFNGLTFLRVSPINFAAIESSGVDFTANYLFSALGGNFNVRLNGTWVDKLDFFTDPGDSSVVDPQLGQIQRPEWSGNASVRYQRGPLGLSWSSMYQDKQLLRGVRAQNGQALFGDSGKGGSYTSHDFSFSYDVQPAAQVYGGISNVFDKDPYITERAWPIGPRGRTLFLGLNYSM